MSDDDAIDDALAACLQGDSAGLVSVVRSASEQDILARLDFHGIAAQVANELAPALPESLRRSLRDRVIAQEFWEEKHRLVLHEVIPALDIAGLSPLLFKGTALAYSLYSRPAMRVRGDTDILVREEGYGKACEILDNLGYTTELTAGGDVISSQKDFSIEDDAGSIHHLDLHGKLNNSALLARTFRHAELWDRRLPLTDLGEAFQRIGNVDSLLIGCMHRLVHEANPYWVNGMPHFSADRLIWFEDIRRLLSALNSEDWDLFTYLAEKKQLVWVVADALNAAGGPSFRKFVGDGKFDAKSKRYQEAPARYFLGGNVRRFIMDVGATAGLAEKMQFIRELLFPATNYMRAKYQGRTIVPLPWLYLRRAMAGLLKSLQKRVRS